MDEFFSDDKNCYYFYEKKIITRTPSWRDKEEFLEQELKVKEVSEKDGSTVRVYKNKNHSTPSLSFMGKIAKLFAFWKH